MPLNATLYVHDCNNVKVGLNQTAQSRWLTISSEKGDANLHLFFESRETQEAVLEKLYTELGKLQPKS